MTEDEKKYFDFLQRKKEELIDDNNYIENAIETIENSSQKEELRRDFRDNTLRLNYIESEIKRIDSKNENRSSSRLR